MLQPGVWEIVVGVVVVAIVFGLVAFGVNHRRNK
jgi:hypothetical protein